MIDHMTERKRRQNLNCQVLQHFFASTLLAEPLLKLRERKEINELKLTAPQ